MIKNFSQVHGHLMDKTRACVCVFTVVDPTENKDQRYKNKNSFFFYKSVKENIFVISGVT